MGEVPESSGLRRADGGGSSALCAPTMDALLFTVALHASSQHAAPELLTGYSTTTHLPVR